MIIYNRIAVIAILLLSLLTTSCNTDYTRNHADEIRESITDVVNGLRDGFYDSTVVVTINDTLASAADAPQGGRTTPMPTPGASAADAEMVASTISMTTADSGRRGGGVTTINIVLPDSNYGPDIDNDIPSFVPPVAIVGTVLIFGAPVLAVFLICYFIYRTKRARYQAVAQIVASGKDIPEGMFPQTDSRAKWNSGIKYVAWGCALMLFFLVRLQIEWAVLMTVPIAIGAGKLIAYRNEQKQKSSSIVESNCGTVARDNDDDTTNFPPIPPRR